MIRVEFKYCTYGSLVFVEAIDLPVELDDFGLLLRVLFFLFV